MFLKKILHSLLMNGTSPEYSRWKNVSIRNTNAAILLTFPLEIFYLIYAYFLQGWPLVIAHGSMLVIFIGALFLMKKGWVLLGRWYSILCGNFYLFSVCSLNGFSSLHFLYFFPVLMGPFILFELDHKISIIFLSSLSALFMALSAFGVGDVLFKNLQTEHPYPPLMSIIGASLFLIGLCALWKTFHQQAIDEREEKELELIHSGRMAALGEMASGIAHEINSPLSIIKGHAEVIHMRMERKTLDREAVTAHALRIESTVDRIAQIVKGLRAFARQDEGLSCEFVSSRKIVETTMDLCYEKFRHHGATICFENVEEETLWVRPMQISQVLLNLLNNSLDAISKLDQRWIQITGKREGSSYRFEVVDSGPGIEAKIASRIMQPFFTTKDVGSGTGLGLSISKGIIESHFGTLDYDPLSAHTKFIIRLPIGKTSMGPKG